LPVSVDLPVTANVIPTKYSIGSLADRNILILSEDKKQIEELRLPVVNPAAQESPVTE